MSARSRAAAAPEVDCGPRERAWHGTLLRRAVDGARASGRRVKFECRLDWYQDKASIDDRQHAAGLRFRADWLLAAMEAKVVGTYGLRVRGPGEFRDHQLAARRRAARALAALAPAERGTVIQVCGFDEWAAGRLPALRAALTQLADHYGLPSEAGRG
jgi:hypothetical protein